MFQSAPGYISYLALFKCSSDAKMVAKALCDKPLKISLSSKEVSVETVEFPLFAKSEDTQVVCPQIIQKVVTNNLPVNNYLNIFPNFLPYSSYFLPQSLNLQNTLNMTPSNGRHFSIINIVFSTTPFQVPCSIMGECQTFIWGIHN